MTIVIAFHGSGLRIFKDFYTRHVLQYWHSAFPNFVSCSRFAELMPWNVMPLACFLPTTFGLVKWYFGLKLHLIINDKRELLAVTLTSGNTDDRKPVPQMTQ
ncbi:MAG: hypothetical protein F6K65_37975 [Moorea sp. SIO3C2]|nr:hypothetical protein [Moorena sp. SIO3C2]